MPCSFCLMNHKEKVVKFGNKRFLLIRICMLPESLIWSSFLLLYSNKVAIYGRAAPSQANCSGV